MVHLRTKEERDLVYAGMPEDLTPDQSEHYALLYQGDDGHQAHRIAERQNAVVYTMVDDSEGGVLYLKGFHWVNRLEYIVLDPHYHRTFKEVGDHERRLKVPRWDWESSSSSWVRRD